MVKKENRRRSVHFDEMLAKGKKKVEKQASKKQNTLRHSIFSDSRRAMAVDFITASRHVEEDKVVQALALKHKMVRPATYHTALWEPFYLEVLSSGSSFLSANLQPSDKLCYPPLLSFVVTGCRGYEAAGPETGRGRPQGAPKEGPPEALRKALASHHARTQGRPVSERAAELQGFKEEPACLAYFLLDALLGRYTAMWPHRAPHHSLQVCIALFMHNV